MSTIGAPSTWEVLTDSLDSSQMAESDILLEDFLNDKLQSAADLDNIASLIEKVENQTKLLEEQQETARIELETAKKASEEHIISMNKLIADFENQQENIDGRMMTVTKSQIPVDAVERLEEPMEKLRRLELAEEYVKLLTDINALAQEARDHLPGDPKSSLRPYTRLKEISLALKKGQEAVEGAAIHLVDYAENITTQLWKQMSKIMIDELLNLSRKELAWPNSSLSIPTNNATERWNKCFTKLLVLQAPELTAFIETPLVLLPMKALAMEHTRAFRYHYMSDKESSNPHHLGELFFPWIISKVKDLEDFLRKEVSPVLQAHFMGSELGGNTLYTDAVSAFITALLPVVREKIFNVMSELDNQPQLMSQFVEELLAFDSSLRGEPFNYTGGNITYGWNGLTWEVMQVWFDRWSEHAKDFALRRYEEIVSDPQNGLIDYESIGPGKTKPTSGVIKVVDLLKTVTEQYKHLGRFSHKVRFLIHIQVAILDEYHERLQGSLNVYQSYSTPLGRTLHGLTKEQEAALSGNGALESLCKVYGSADYVIHALQEWSNEQFFIELWNELQRRARATTANQTIAGPMTVNQVKNITSTALGAPDEDGAMFDETIDSYKSLRTMSERYIIDKIRNGFQISFRPYLVKPDWHGHTDDPIDIPSLSVTAELDRPLETLRADMMFLKGVLSAVPFRRIWRECLKSLEDHLYGELLMRQQYTALGAAQFKRDVSEICDVIEDASRDVKGTAFDMPRLKEAVDVLTLPVQAENGRLSLKEAFHFTHTTPDIEPIVSQLRLKVLQPREIRALVELRLEVGAYE